MTLLWAFVAACEAEPPPSDGESTLEALHALEQQRSGGSSTPAAPAAAADESGPGGLTRTIHAFYRSYDGTKGDLEVAVVFDYDATNLHAFSVGRGSRILGVAPATPPGGPEIDLPPGRDALLYKVALPADAGALRGVRVFPVDGTEPSTMTPGAGMRSRTDYLPPIPDGRAAFVTLDLEGDETILYPIVRGGDGMPGVPRGKLDRGDVPRRLPTAVVYLENLRRVLDWLRSDRSAAYPIREARPLP